MQITGLGNSGSYPGPGKACSGLLVVEGTTKLLVDCGTGVFAGLQQHASLTELDAVVISHMHADHFLDLVPVRYALAYGKRRRREPLPLYLPPGGHDVWERLVAPLAEPDNCFSAPFDIREYAEGKSYPVGGLTLRFTAVKHFVPSYAITIKANKTLVYSGDTAPCANLQKVARGADLFICEATWLSEEEDAPDRGHMTAAEAGQIALQAGVPRLLLTHISPDIDPAKSLAAAREHLAGARIMEQHKTFSLR